MLAVTLLAGCAGTRVTVVSDSSGRPPLARPSPGTPAAQGLQIGVGRGLGWAIVLGAAIADGLAWSARRLGLADCPTLDRVRCDELRAAQGASQTAPR